MTQVEKDSKMQSINERLLYLSAEMSASDAHASKCIKLGIAFKDAYPSEYESYTKAREEYNTLEAELKAIEAIEIEEEHPTDVA